MIHTWDLAKAVGQTPVLDAGHVERGITQLVRAGKSLVGPGRFDAAVEVGDDIDPVSKLVALSGRNPD